MCVNKKCMTYNQAKRSSFTSHAKHDMLDMKVDINTSASYVSVN